jgi:hypothetical protein
VIYLRIKEKKGKSELIICFKVSLPPCLPPCPLEGEALGLGAWGLGLVTLLIKRTY